MKYYLTNKDDVKKNIWENPKLIKTKSMSKVKKIRALQKKLDVLMKAVVKELKESNVGPIDEKLDALLKDESLTEITKSDYNSMYVVSLYDTQEQRIRAYNKTEVLKGKLYGNEIK